MRPNILFIVPSDYDSLQQKGVLHMIEERDEDGFFENVVTVHPVTSRTRVVKINSKNYIYEFGFDRFSKYRNINLVKYLYYFVSILKLIINLPILAKREKIHIIRATDPYITGFLAWWVSKWTCIPFCISIHSDYDKCYQLDNKKGAPAFFGSRRLAKKMEKFVLSRAPIVMPIREHLAEEAVKNGAMPEAIRVIPHGIDLKAFISVSSSNIYEMYNIPKYKKVLGFVGRLANENYVDDILKLAESLKMKRLDWNIIMAGGGCEEERILKEISKGELTDMIKLVGFQSRDKIIAIRQQSYASLCLMSGFSLIEACAGGRPVIAYDVEWHRELVKSGETGFLIAESDIQGLVEAICYLLDKPKEAKIMGDNARKQVMIKHSIESTSKIKAKYYEELLQISKQ